MVMHGHPWGPDDLGYDLGNHMKPPYFGDDMPWLRETSQSYRVGHPWAIGKTTPDSRAVEILRFQLFFAPNVESQYNNMFYRLNMSLLLLRFIPNICSWSLQKSICCCLSFNFHVVPYTVSYCCLNPLVKETCIHIYPLNYRQLFLGIQVPSRKWLGYDYVTMYDLLQIGGLAVPSQTVFGSINIFVDDFLKPANRPSLSATLWETTIEARCLGLSRLSA